MGATAVENGFVEVDGIRTAIPECKCGCGRYIRPVFFKGTWRLDHPPGSTILYYSGACRQRYLKAVRANEFNQLKEKVRRLEDELQSVRQTA